MRFRRWSREPAPLGIDSEHQPQVGRGRIWVSAIADALRPKNVRAPGSGYGVVRILITRRDVGGPPACEAGFFPFSLSTGEQA